MRTRTRSGAWKALVLVPLVVLGWPGEPVRAQALPHAHYCVLYGHIPPAAYNGGVYYGAEVQCYTDASRTVAGQAGLIDLTVELVDVGAGPFAGNTGRTPNGGNMQAVGVAADTCPFSTDPRYYGRATATVQFLSGTPEYLSASMSSPAVAVGCRNVPPPTIPDFTIPDISIPPVTIPQDTRPPVDCTANPQRPRCGGNPGGRH